MEDLLISVCSPPEIDMDIYGYWIDGFTPDEVAKVSPFRGNHFEFSYRVEESSADMMRMFQFDIEDQFRCFEVLEHYLMQPYLLRSQSVCTVGPELQSFLIEKYWSLDDAFIRELLNKKLTKSRKDLEDASETTGLHLRSVMRQFDNIKRIYAAFEDTTNSSGNAFQFISKNYLISAQLAKKYTCLIYLMDSKFNLTTKKRLAKVPYPSLETCAAVTMSCLNVDTAAFVRILQADALSDPQMFLDNSQFAWSYVWRVFPSVEQFEVDKQLLTSLRDLRTVLTGDMLDAGCASVRSRLSATVLRKLEGSVSFGYSFSTRLRTAIKGLLTIGSNLSQTKEFRDLYEDILTKVAEPLEECGVSMSEMGSIIAACYYAAEEIPEMGKGGHHHHHHHAPSASTSTTTTTTTATSAANALGMSSSSSMAATTAYGNGTSANAGLTAGAMGSGGVGGGGSGGGSGGGGVGGVSGGGNAVGSVFAASNISVRTSDGLTSRTDASVVTVGRESTGTQLTDRNSLIGGNSNAGGGGIGYTSGHYSASSSSMHVNQSYVSSTRIQSKAYYMRADWLRFLLFCKLTLTEFMMVDTNRRL